MSKDPNDKVAKEAEEPDTAAAGQKGLAGARAQYSQRSPSNSHRPSRGQAQSHNGRASPAGSPDSDKKKHGRHCLKINKREAYRH